MENAVVLQPSFNVVLLSSCAVMWVAMTFMCPFFTLLAVASTPLRTFHVHVTSTTKLHGNLLVNIKTHIAIAKK